MREHVYQRPYLPHRGMVFVHGDIHQTWLPGAPVVPGSIWCWEHNSWEDIPPFWRKREELLRARIILEWDTSARYDACIESVMTDLITEYCRHHGWEMPNLANRDEVIAFVTAMKNKTLLM